MKPLIKSLIAAALFCIVASSAVFASDDATYASKEHYFTLQYPGKWEIKERISGAAVSLLAPKEEGKDVFRANVNVVEQDVPADIELKKFADASLSVMDKLMKGYKEISREETTIGTLKVVRVVYTYSFEDYELKMMLVLAVSGKHGFAITCAAEASTFEAFKKSFDDIVNSFKPV